jgi:hypothetical protein
VGDRAEPWFRQLRLSDGSDYLRWAGLFEFAVSPDGRVIHARAVGGSTEAFRTYLLGQVLSFALVRRGMEPLHSTTAVIDGRAVAFIGDCGYGKSTLGAACLRAGYPLVTDDLLVLAERSGEFLAQPGPPRIKLFPHVADRLLGPARGGRAMNHLTPKRVIPLAPGQAAPPAPLRAIFVLMPSRARRERPRISIRRLSQRRACIELIRSTFNPMITEAARLERQLHLAARVAERVPMFALSYPRRLSRLPAVIDAVRARLAG